jgi:serine/threonine-protein kinase
MVRLRLLGPFEITDGPVDITPSLVQAKPRALLAYLACSPQGFHRRDRLVALLWPELDESHARNALSKAVHLCRRALGETVLESRGAEEIGLRPGAVRCDVALLRESASAGRHREAMEHYRRGALLDGFHLADAPEFDHWLDQERDRLRRTARQVGSAAATEAEARGDLSAAADWLREVSGLDPLDEPIVRRRITLLDRMGDRAGALGLFQAYAERVRVELKSEPSPETIALIEAVRARNGRAIPVVGTGAAVASTARDEAPPASVVTKSGRSRWAVLGAAVALVVTLAAMTLALRKPPPHQTGRVLVLALENATGDTALARLGGLVASWISEGLSRMGVNVVDPVTAFYLDADVGRDGASEVARAVSAGTLVSGRFGRQGDSLAFEVWISDAVEERQVASIRLNTAEDPVSTGGLDRLRQSVVGMVAARLDVNLRSLGIERLAPPRLDAYAEFVHGLELFKASEASLLVFLRAARLDSTFILPVVWARYAAGNGGLQAVADSLEMVMKGILARSGSSLSALDRAALESFVLDLDIERIQAIRRAARLAPGSNWSYMQGLRETRVRQKVASFEEVNRDVGWARGWIHIYDQLASAHHILGDYRRQLVVAREGLLTVPEGWPRFWLRRNEVTALAAMGRLDEIARVVDVVEGTEPSGPGGPDWIMLEAARELAAHGYRKASLQVLARAERWIREHPGEDAYGRALAFGEIAYYRGEWSVARSWFDSASVYAAAPAALTEARVKAAVTVALAGDASQARDLLERAVQGMSPEPRHAHYLARARLAAATGDGDEAARLLREWRAAGGRAWAEGDRMHDPAWSRVARHRGYLAFLRGE